MRRRGQAYLKIFWARGACSSLTKWPMLTSAETQREYTYWSWRSATKGDAYPWLGQVAGDDSEQDVHDELTQRQLVEQPPREPGQGLDHLRVRRPRRQYLVLEIPDQVLASRAHQERGAGELLLVPVLAVGGALVHELEQGDDLKSAPSRASLPVRWGR